MKSKMKIIFLDIDGVLNSQYFNYRLKEPYFDPIDPDAIKRLNTIIEKTDAKIVISSAWRYSYKLEEIVEIFKNHGFKGEIIGTTDVNSFNYRGIDIYNWKSENNITKYCIIDDDCDMMYEQKDLFVHVSNNVGLTYKDVTKAINILNDTKKSKKYSNFKLKRITYYKKFIDFLYSFLYK